MYDGHNDGDPETIERASEDGGFPLGIQLLAGANILSAVLIVLIAFIVLASSGNGLLLVGLIGFWVSVPLLFVARALLKLRFWAWVLTLIAQTVLLFVYGALAVGGNTIAILPLIVGVAAVAYLVSVRDMYRGNSEHTT